MGGGGREILIIIISSLLLYGFTAIADTNTLHQSDTLNFTQHLVSTNNNFTLGFSIPSQFPNNTYLAIWYFNDSSNPIWIANRDTPITNGSASLIFDSTGMLLINPTHAHPIHLCPPETTTAAANTSAVLLDNGNLVVREVNSNGSTGRTLWQSFDCPSDTLLPQMKLGVNHRTDRNWSLTSWLAQDDPSPGPFTLEWDPTGVQMVIRRRGVVFWTSGVLKDDYFEHMSQDYGLIQYYDIKSTTTLDEDFLSYSMKKDPLFQKYHANIEWRIDYKGTLSFEGFGILFQDICYGYNTDRGCAEWTQTQPKCRNEQTTFELLNGYFVKPAGVDPDIGLYVDGDIDNGYIDESIGPGDCRLKCWNDCDCQAYLDRDTMGCITHTTKVEFRRDPSGKSHSYYVIQRPQKRRKKQVLLIAILVPLSLLLVSIIVIIFYLRRKVMKSRNDLLQLMAPLDTLHNANELEYDKNFAQNLEIFSFASIVEATNNFSVQNKLGEGGFGPVYKGKLAEGRKVAIKRLSRNSGQGLVEFKNELILIAKLQHMNLVRLLGCSIQAHEKMLVYEYMPNKSLDSFLFDPSKKSVLNWRKRMMIIEGISQGLLYLHQHSRLRIIHRDLKASNILLDAELIPKISDFGMAKIFKQNELIANTNRIVGTYGYMSPEYAMDGIFSVKSDIFSFGVLILEILSGKRNNSFYNVNGPLNLVGYAWELWQRGGGLDLMDPTISESCCAQEFLRVIHVCLLCVEDSPPDRPTISQVISMITNESTHLPSLKKPAFTYLDSVTNATSQRNDLEYHSVNGLSVSTMNAR